MILYKLQVKPRVLSYRFQDPYLKSFRSVEVNFWGSVFSKKKIMQGEDGHFIVVCENYLVLTSLIFGSPARSAQSYCCHLGHPRLRLSVRPRHTFG